MICFVDIEHEMILRRPDRRAEHLSYVMDVKLKLEEISGLPCLVQRFSDVTRENLRELGITHLAISGNATDWDDYGAGAFSEMEVIIREPAWPIIGFCGGAQLIAASHGAALGPMRPLAPDEPEITTLSAPGYFKEWGFMTVTTERSDPLFEGLAQSPIFLQAHYWEIKEVPPAFEVLASSDECSIQVIKHETELVYGTQFHPEAYTERPFDRPNPLVDLIYPERYDQEHVAGKTLLTNFFRITGMLD